MSSELEEAILSIRKKVSQKRALFSSGQGAESTVVDNIIRPVLRALGWTTGENMILHESEVKLRAGKGRADLVLSKGPGEYILAVEAKKLGTKIDGSTETSEDYIEQLINYLISLNREFGILTNGEWWHLIRRAGFDWDTVWMKNLLKDDLPELVRTLLYVSPENSEKLSSRIELEQHKKEVLGKEWVRIQQDRDLQLKVFGDILLEQVKGKYSDITIDAAEVKEFLRGRYYGLSGSEERAPTIQTTSIIDGGTGTYTFSLDGRINSVKRMKEALVITAEWLITRGDLDSNSVPIESGKSRYLVAKKPIHRNDRKFDSAFRLSNGLFLETNFSAKDYKKKAWELLEHFKYDRSLAIFSW